MKNKVNVNDLMLGSILRIVHSNNAIEYWEVTLINESSFFCRLYGSNNTPIYDSKMNLEYVPISGDVLEMLGFIKINEYDYVIHDIAQENMLRVTINDKYYFSFSFNYAPLQIVKKPEYIHELQLVYKVFTNEEL